jgi:asparagine synthase (glutamine-hydrolysing)
MCGITGIFNLKEKPISEEQLTLMNNELKLRGPDDAGIYVHKNVGLAHRRLSIIDTSINGHQPMISENGNFIIVFNGEIYNYKEYITDLKSKGYKFRSNSDTEVLLNLYIEYGCEALPKLNGMFSFAIYDIKNEELFIGRDRLGVKPLYYAFDNNEFIFASEPKALFASGVLPTIKESNINEWLVYRYTAGEETLYSNVKKLLPGHFAVINKVNGLKIKQWWNLSERIQKHKEINNPISWFFDTFQSSVNYRMVSDVPVGVLLSGGLDSSSVAASLKRNGFNGIHTYNVGFKNYINDESEIARRFSKELGFPFHSIYLENEDLHESLIQSTINYDEPLVHLNDPHIYRISQVAKKHVKVLLSGEGADEILGGYIRYKTSNLIRIHSITSLLLSLTPERLKSTRIKKLERYFKLTNTEQLIMSNSANYFDSDFHDLGLPYLGISNDYRLKIATEAKELFGNNIKKRLLYYDQHTYLQSLNDRNDRATMGASIECREPFQDYRLIEGIGHLNSEFVVRGKKGKYLLTESMKSILPDYILNYKKVGFGVPWKKHIIESNSLRSEFNDFENSDIFDRIGLANDSKKQLFNTFWNTSIHHYDQLCIQLFTFFIWEKYYLKKFNS